MVGIDGAFSVSNGAQALWQVKAFTGHVGGVKEGDVIRVVGIIVGVVGFGCGVGSDVGGSLVNVTLGHSLQLQRAGVALR